MKDRRWLWVALALVMVLGGAMTRAADQGLQPVRGYPSADPSGAVAPPGRTAEPTYHDPTAGESWRAGSTLAQPCPAVTAPVTERTLLPDGPVAAQLDGFTNPTLRLRSGGTLDLSDGRLGVAGGEYLPDPAEAYFTDVPPGAYPVTVAELSDDGGATLAAAEVRFSNATPVRWEWSGSASTDGGQGAWFSPGGQSQVLATGYEPLEQADARGSGIFDVVSYWLTPCYFLDVAPREPSQPHDVVVFNLGSDGGYPQWAGYDSAGKLSAVILQVGLPWSALGLPGIAPPGAEGEEDLPSPRPAATDSTSPTPVPRR